MPEGLQQREEGGEDNGKDDGDLHPLSGPLPFLGVDRKPLEDLEHRHLCLYKLTVVDILRTDVFRSVQFVLKVHGNQ